MSNGSGSGRAGGPPSGGGGGNAGSGAGAARRIVHIDANVIDQINRGNQPAAQRLRALLNDPNVTVRISPWAYQELVVQPGIGRTAVTNRMMLSELNIPQATQPTREQAIEISALGQNETKRGNYKGSVASIRDTQVIASARLENAEVWGFDGVFRNNPQGVQKAYGIRVAPESQAIEPRRGDQDYRVGRQLMGLPEIDVSADGVVAPRGGGGGPPRNGGGTGPSQRSPGRLRQGLRIAGYAGASAVGFLLTLLLGGTLARLQESSMQKQRNALEPRIRKDFRQIKEQAIRLLVAGKEAHLVLHFKTSSLDVHMGPGGGWSDTWPSLEYLGMEIRESPVGPVEADGKTKWILVRYDRGGKMIVPGAMTGPSYWYDQSAALSLSPEDAAVYRDLIKQIEWLKRPKMQPVPANNTNNVWDHPSFRTQEDKDKMEGAALWLQLQALLDEEEKLAP